MPSLAADYLQYMHDKPKIDLSSVILAPMPGMIKTVNVTVGQMVLLSIVLLFQNKTFMFLDWRRSRIVCDRSDENAE